VGVLFFAFLKIATQKPKIPYRKGKNLTQKAQKRYSKTRKALLKRVKLLLKEPKSLTQMVKKSYSNGRNCCSGTLQYQKYFLKNRTLYPAIEIRGKKTRSLTSYPEHTKCFSTK
jgi:hypothetical protein